MHDRVVVQIGTKEDPKQLDFLLLFTKDAGKKLGFDDRDDITWTPGPMGGVWSTLNQEDALGWARLHGQSSIHDNVHYKPIFELQWVEVKS